MGQFEFPRWTVPLLRPSIFSPAISSKFSVHFARPRLWPLALRMGCWV